MTFERCLNMFVILTREPMRELRKNKHTCCIDFMEECELGKLAQLRLLWNSFDECFCTGDAGDEDMYGRSKCWSIL